MGELEAKRYHLIIDALNESETKDEFLESVDSVLDELFEGRTHAQHNLDVLSDDDWWTGNMM